MKSLKIQYPACTFSVILAMFLLVPAVYALDYHQNCSWCHVQNVHGAPGDTLLNNAAGANAVCRSCHIDGNDFTDQDGNTYTPPVVQTHRGISCTQCHEAHKNRENFAGTRNVSLVGISYDSNGNAQGDNIAQIYDNYGSGNGNPVNVRYLGPTRAESGLTYPFHDGTTGGTNEGVCSACHQPSHHSGITSSNRVNCLSGGMCHSRSMGGRPGPDVVECTRCHTHTVGFTP